MAQLARPGALSCPADSTAPPAPLLLLLFQTRITMEGQQEGKEQTGAALGHHITPAPVSEPTAGKGPGSTGDHWGSLSPAISSWPCIPWAPLSSAPAAPRCPRVSSPNSASTSMLQHGSLGHGRRSVFYCSSTAQGTGHTSQLLLTVNFTGLVASLFLICAGNQGSVLIIRLHTEQGASVNGRTAYIC